MMFNCSASQAKNKLDMIFENIQHYSKLSGMITDSLKILIDGLIRDFCD